MNIITITFDSVGKFSVASSTNIQQGNHLVDQFKFVFDSSWGTITQVQVHALLPDEVTVTPNTVLTISSVGGAYWTYDVPSWFTQYAGQLKLAISVSYALVGEETPKRFSRIIPLYVDRTVVSEGSFEIDPIVEDSLLTSIADLTARMIVVENNYLKKVGEEEQTVEGVVNFDEITIANKYFSWNTDEGTFDVEMMNGAVLQLGQEFYFYGKAIEAIAEGRPVQFAGAEGGHIKLKNAVPSEINANPEYMIGIATTTFSGNGVFGYVTILGKVKGLNTNSYNEGDILWFDSTNGGLTTTKPSSPKAKIEMGAVLRKHATQGSIIVRVGAAMKLGDLQDVSVNGETNGTVLTYDSVLGYWEGKAGNYFVYNAAANRDTDISIGVGKRDIGIQAGRNMTISATNSRTDSTSGNYTENVTGDRTEDTFGNSAESVFGYHDEYAVGYHTITSVEYIDLIAPSVKANGSEILTDANVIGKGILLNEATDPTTAVEITRTGNFAWNSVNGNMTFNALNGAITLNSDVGNINATTQLNLVSPDIQLSGNVTIGGDLFLQGKGYENELETLLIKDNELVLRGGALTGLGSGEYSGFRFKLYDGTNDGLLVVGNDGFARVGDVGALQIIATRQDSPTSNGVAYFNSSAKRFDTDSGFSYDPSTDTLSLKNIIIDGDATFNKTAVDYTETYSNTISSTFGDIVPYKDGTPLVTEISGRTIPSLSNLVTNGDFSSADLTKYSGSGTLSIISNKLSFVDSSNLDNYFFIETLSNETNHLYYFKFDFIQNGSSNLLIENSTAATNQLFGVNSVSTTGKYSGVYNRSLYTLSTTILMDNAGPVYTDWQFDNVILIDLTATFGAGLEPTATEMDKIIEAIGTNGYISTTPTTHVENTTLKSTGKNLFDKKQAIINYVEDGIGNLVPYPNESSTGFIRVKPLTTYVRNWNNGYGQYDINHAFLGYTPSGLTFTTSANTAYLRLNVANTAIETAQLEQGSTATAYTPYKSETQSFVHGRLSRLPNNVSDKIRYDNGKYVLDRYVQEYTLQASDIGSYETSAFTNVDYLSINYTNLTNYIFNGVGDISPNRGTSILTTFSTPSLTGFVDDLSFTTKHYANSGDIAVIFPKGAYANLAAAQTALAGTKIWYQLATPLLATEVIDVDGTLIQDSVTTIEQTQALATEYDVKFAINAEQTVVNLVDRDKIQQEVIDANEQKLEPITNSNGNIGIGTPSPSAKLHVAGDLKVNTGGTLLASGTGITTASVADLRTYKYIELRAGIDDRTSTKIPSSLLYYSLGGSNGISLAVGYYYGSTPTAYVIIPIRMIPANSGYTSIEVMTDITDYDLQWEIYGWNY